MFGFISKRDHDVIVAAKDAEMSGITDALARSRSAHRLTAELLRTAEARNGDLNRQLAVFTAPRNRDAKGHFLPLSARNQEQSQ